jgi:hypothetical protein
VPALQNTLMIELIQSANPALSAAQIAQVWLHAKVVYHLSHLETSQIFVPVLQNILMTGLTLNVNLALSAAQIAPV